MLRWCKVPIMFIAAGAPFYHMKVVQYITKKQWHIWMKLCYNLNGHVPKRQLPHVPKTLPKWQMAQPEIIVIELFKWIRLVQTHAAVKYIPSCLLADETTISIVIFCNTIGGRPDIDRMTQSRSDIYNNSSSKTFNYVVNIHFSCKLVDHDTNLDVHHRHFSW